MSDDKVLRRAAALMREPRTSDFYRAVADWLDRTAATAGLDDPAKIPDSHLAHALAVARTYLGSDA